MIIKTIDEIQIVKPKESKISTGKTVKYKTDYKGIVTETECENEDGCTEKIPLKCPTKTHSNQLNNSTCYNPTKSICEC